MSKKNASKFAHQNEKSESAKLLSGAITGAVAAIVFTLALTFIASVIVLGTADPDSLTSLAAYAVLAVSLFAGGIAAVKASGGSVLASLAAGAIYTVAAFCIHLVATAKSDPSGPLSLLFIAFPFISALGGLVGRPRSQKNKPKFKSR